jgi:hypothetical protein
MGVIISRTKQLTANGATNVCASQTPLAAGNLTINGTAASGGVATLDSQRRILFTFAADETGHTFVVYGTNQGGNPIQESVAGTTAGTVATNLDFLTVTQITISAAATGAITVGTNTVGSTPWQSVDLLREPVNVAFQVAITGTINYTVEYTQTDVNTLAPGAYAIPFAHPSVANKTDNETGSFVDPISYFRLTINSGTGASTLTYAQAGP